MEKKELKNTTINSIVWKFFERILAQGVTFVVTMVLARILVPEDYSVVSIVTVFFAFCNVLITGGLNTSLIRKKDSDIIDYSTILYFSLAMATILYVVMFCAAPYIADIYKKDILILVFRVMGIMFFINAAKSVIYAYIAHGLNFRMFFWATLFGTLTSAVVGISLAKCGAGPWALIFQQLTNNTIDLIILSFITKIKFRFVFSFERLKYHLGYSWKIFLASIIDTIYNQIKPLIIGIRYTTTDLAYYNKGDNFPTLINTTISNTMSSVLFAAYSKLQDDKDALLAAVRRYIKLSSYIMFPAMMGLAVVGDTLVEVLLTEKWLPAVPFLRIFCFVYMFDLIHVANLHALKAIGRTDLTLIMEIIKKILYFLTILSFVLLSKNTMTFALCNLVCSIIGTVVNTFPNRTIFNYKYRYQISDISKNFVCAGLMAILVLIAKNIPLDGVILLLIQVVIGVVSYIGFSIIFRNENMYYFLNILKEKFL